jgi:hypothetical protein
MEFKSCRETLFIDVEHKYLPSKIKKLENFNRFRKEVKLALLSNSFYRLEEFVQTD